MATQKDTDKTPTAVDVPPTSDSNSVVDTADSNSGLNHTYDERLSPVRSPAKTETETVESRRYIEIRPSTDPLNASAASRAMMQLYESLYERSSAGLWSSLRNTSRQPMVEWLLVADGRADTSLRYLVGTTHDAHLDELQAILRTAVPDTYELRQVEWHPREIAHDVAPTSKIDTSAFETSSPDTATTVAPDEDSSDSTHQLYAAGVEYRGATELRQDWQTSLVSFEEFIDQPRRSRSDEHESSSRRIPLATLVETLCDSPVPVVYQAICHPTGDQRGDAEQYRYDLERGVVTPVDRILDFVFPREIEKPETADLPASYQDRLVDLDTRDLRRTFCLTARAVALTDLDNSQRAETVARRLENVFGHVGGPFHSVRGRVVTDTDLHTGGVPPASQLLEDIYERSRAELSYETVENRLPWKPNRSAGIAVSPDELPGFCLIDGVGLPPTGQRALSARRSERTGLALPPPVQLDQYSGVGQALCMPLTDDRRPYGQPFVLPPALQDRHLFVVGDTGSGKSVLTIGAMRSNVEATAGPEILFDYKGGGTAEEYLKTHYKADGDLEGVRYFDLTKTLPALSIFDIRSLLDAGLSREEARSRIAGHYEEVLAGLMGPERYYGATESTKAIRNHLRALFDPIHGSDTVSHNDLYAALQRTLSDQTPPPTSDDRLTEYFAGLLERDRDVFNKVLGGAVARVETIATDDRLAPLFDHVHTPKADKHDEAEHEEAEHDEAEHDEAEHDEAEHDEAEHEGDIVRNSDTDTDATDAEAPAHFDFMDVIDDDVVVLFDFGGMDERIKRALTLVVLSNLWTALKARAEAPETVENPPQVNLYLEEAKDVAATQLVDTLLSQGRSFGLSVMLGVQFPSQLDSPDPSNQTYEEALNEIGTFVVGNVAIEDDLAKTLATGDLSPTMVARRLSAIRHGEWLVRPAAEFGSPAPRPFLGRSLPAPTGHPASATPLSDNETHSFEMAFELTRLETWNDAGLAHETDPMRVDRSSESGDDASTEDGSDEVLRVDSLLPHTRRLPDCVEYDESIHGLRCGSCDNRYDPSIRGMKRAIECCHSLDEVDPDDIPVCDLSLKLTPEEREASEWSDRQLLFLQTVYNAQQLRYDTLEYNLLHDSMIRLQEYVDIETDEIEPLLDTDLLRHDTDHPHRLYTVSSDGRSTIGESYRMGVDFGHGMGDLEESSEHVFGIEVTRQYLEEAYAANPDSRVETVVPYYDIDDQHRLDVAGIDADGEIVVTAEVERINNDVHRAVPEDYDKMADCEPDEAIWVVMKQADGHKLISSLNDPLEGEPRVEKTYAKTTPPQQFRIDTPGMTAVYPAEWLRDRTESGEFPNQ